MADALRFDVQCAPNRFRPGGFAGMGGEMESVFGGAHVNVREPLRRTFRLVAADTERNDIAVAKPNRQIKHPLRLLNSKLPDSIEDPQKRNAEVAFAARAAALQALENCREILLAPQADADRNNHLGMKNVLRFQPLHQPVCNQLVVVGRAQVAGDIFKGDEESGKVPEVVKPFDLGKRGVLFAVAVAEFEQRSRLDGAFEVEVKFGLRKSRESRVASLLRAAADFKDRVFGTSREADSQTYLAAMSLL